MPQKLLHSSSIYSRIHLNSQVENLYEHVNKLNKNATFFEAYDDDTLVGLVAIYKNNYETKIAFISSVIISAEYQGKGIAHNLLESAIKAAISEGFIKIKLEVFYNNTKAIRLYKRLRFEEQNKGFIVMEFTSPPPR